MSKLYEAICLNNGAVDQLLHVQGSVPRALQVLADALKLMKEELITAKEIRLRQTTSSNHHHQQRHRSFLEQTSAETTSHFVMVPRMELSETIFFNQAVLLRLPSEMVAGAASPNSGEVTERYIHMYIAAVIFNLALAHHYTACSSDTNSSLIKAEKLYEMVIRLLNSSDDGEVMGMPISKTIAIIRLACINNMSQIQYYSRGEHSINTIHDLFYQVHSLYYSRGDRSMVLLQQDPTIQGLLTNLVLLQDPRALQEMAAPAA